MNLIFNIDFLIKANLKDNTVNLLYDRDKGMIHTLIPFGKFY
jgi:hypothetical protein